MLKQFVSTLRAVLRRSAFEDEMQDEMRFHLEQRAADLAGRGLPPDEARRRARLSFGSIESHKDLARESFGLRLFDELRGDIRLALRRLASRRAYALFIIATIALGIGAATAVFSVVDQTLLRPAPFLYPDRLVDVIDFDRKAGGGGNSLSPAKILGWQSQPALFERFEAVEPMQFDVAGDGTPERVAAGRVTLGLLPMLGVSPILGRGFVDGDGQPGSNRVVIISDALWRRRFAGGADVLGRLITLNEQDYTIVGVMARRFRLLGDQQLWLPFDLAAYAGQSRGFAFFGVGRLAQSVRMPGAQALANQLSDRLQQDSPLPRSWDLRLWPKHIAKVDATTRTAMFVLLGAVGFVLLITCANVTSLLLTEVPGRLREMAVRSALGGSRGRLMRSMLTETTVLIAAGGALGIALARWAVGVMLMHIPEGLIAWATTTIEVDGRVLAMASVIVAATAFAVGIVPALRGSSAKSDEILKTGGGRASRTRLPGALVVLEVAFALVLLAGAALMTRTLIKLESIDSGFDPDGLVAMHVDLSSDRYSTVEARAAFFDEVQRRIARVRGVSGSTVTEGVPPVLGGNSWGELEEGNRGTIQPDAQVIRNTITPSYFPLTRTQLVDGRNFRDDEPADSVIVSEALARLLAPAGSAVGRRVRIGGGNWSTVVGVARTVEARIGDMRSPLQMYSPWPRTAGSVAAARPLRRVYYWRMLIVRASDPTAVVPAIEQQIWSVDPKQPIERVALVTEMYGEGFGRQRFVLMLMSAFSVVALTLTAAGIFGLLAQMVAQRTREIGIRMALGATRAQVLGLITARGLTLTSAGVVLGVSGALALTPVLKSLLFEVTPSDPVSYAAIVALIAVVALAACSLPARMATKVNPADALRVD